MPNRHHATTIMLALSLGLSLSSAQADTVSHDTAVLPMQRTNWQSFLDLQQFDPSLGTLQSVTVALFADVFGSAKAESRNNTAATITLNLGATVSLAIGGDSTFALIQATPTVLRVFQASRADGRIDYAGTSGISHGELFSHASSSASFSSADMLAMFTGTGFVGAPVTARGVSNYTGPGNVITSFRTDAGAHASVSYLYAAAPVPELTTWALMLAGLGAVGMLASRRRTA